MPPVIEFACPHCSRVTRVPPNLAGKQGRCSGCRKVIEVPAGLVPRESGRQTAATGDLQPWSGAENPAAVPRRRPSDQQPVPERASRRAPPPLNDEESSSAPQADAVLPCPACGEDIPRLASECPECGSTVDAPLGEALGESTGKLPPPSPEVLAAMRERSASSPASAGATAAGAAISLAGVTGALLLAGVPPLGAVIVGVAASTGVALGKRGVPWKVAAGVPLSLLMPVLGIALCLLGLRDARARRRGERLAQAGIAIGAVIFAANLAFFIVARTVLAPAPR